MQENKEIIYQYGVRKIHNAPTEPKIIMIRRSKRKERFTIVSNEPIENPNIKWASLGLLTYLLSKPDKWKINVKQLIKSRESTNPVDGKVSKGAGRDAIYAMLKNLSDNGYISRKPLKTGGWEWIVYDAPEYNPDFEPESGLSGYGLSVSGLSVSGLSRHIVNTDTLVNTEKESNTEAPPENLNLEAWDRWVVHRKKMKYPVYTTNSKRNQLATLPKDKQLECVNHSIDNGYKGIFPERFLKVEKKNNQSHYDNQSTSYKPPTDISAPKSGKSQIQSIKNRKHERAM